MSESKETLATDDVIQFAGKNRGYFDLATLVKFDDLQIAISNALYEKWNSQEQNIVHSGIECQVLRPGHPEGWRNGKIRLAFEFIPNLLIQAVEDNQIDLSKISEESQVYPLDEIRIDLIENPISEVVNVY